MGQGEKTKKRGRKKIIVLILVLVAAVAVIAAAFLLMGQNSEGKKQYQQEIQQEARNFTDQLIDGLDDSSGASTGELLTEGEQQAVAKELAKLDDTKKQQTLKTLSAAYSQALNKQKQEAFRMADNLVEEGKADWKALAARGENTAANKAKLASEYLARSAVLENQMDESFNALISKMEAQLTAEGIDPSELIAEYNAQYKKIKAENKSALMDKAMAALKK